jgi:tetraacyldisaccharide 4'-kinase
VSRPLHSARRLLGPLLEPFYRFEVSRRNARYDTGRGVTRLPCPVISIGNLTTGGTGKTPMVAWCVRTLAAAGHRPAIAMRGYRADASGRSDEADEYRAALADLFPAARPPGVPIVAQPNRLAGLLALFASSPTPPVSVVLLDDGFQHRRLHRDLDLVLLDATVDPTTERLLPTGDLREPVESLARAGGLILTHAERLPPGQTPAWFPALGRPPLAITEHTWADLLDASGTPHPVDALTGRRILAVCGIGNPTPFLDRCTQAAGPAGQVTPCPLPDHDPFAPATVGRLERLFAEHHCDALLTTGKDWTKLASRWPAALPAFRARLILRFRSGQADLRDRLLAAAGPAPNSLRPE